jgi:hypothetical protein
VTRPLPTTTPNRLLPGHALHWEGGPHAAPGSACCPDLLDRPYRIGTAGTGDGHALCQCGETSPHLTTNRARKQWHREHKAAVRAAADKETETA